MDYQKNKKVNQRFSKPKESNTDSRVVLAYKMGSIGNLELWKRHIQDKIAIEYPDVASIFTMKKLMPPKKPVRPSKQDYYFDDDEDDDSDNADTRFQEAERLYEMEYSEWIKQRERFNRDKKSSFG